jgi:chemosensory pili system protein ChpA (sensor histidine kinase/response regulator)
MEIVAVDYVSVSQHNLAATPARMVDAPDLHVLVVDDSLSVRRAVCLTLEQAEWQTTTAKDGIEALEKLLNFRPDVALVDIEMPRMNGFELLARIRSEADLRSLPVIFLTSRASAKHRERAQELGCDGYIVKPYRNDELIDEVRRVVSVRQI